MTMLVLPTEGIMASPKLHKGRESRAFAWYAVTTVTAGRTPLFTRPDLARIVGDELAAIPERLAIIHAWVVMPDHVHWLFELGTEKPLGALVQRFKSRCAIGINRCRGSNTHVWQAGYYDHRLREHEDFVAQARYIVANPLRRGLVERIEDYPYWWCRWVRNQADLA
jgi:putative transposase